MHIFGIAIYIVLLLASSWINTLTGGTEGNAGALNAVGIASLIILTLLGAVGLLLGAGHLLDGVGH